MSPKQQRRQTSSFNIRNRPRLERIEKIGRALAGYGTGNRLDVYHSGVLFRPWAYLTTAPCAGRVAFVAGREYGSSTNLLTANPYECLLGSLPLRLKRRGSWRAASWRINPPA